jgi:YesN/AraC family two-component response regulator
MVLLHQGTIDVQSEVGKGSVFTISLPLGKEHLGPNDIIPNFQDSEQIDNYRFSDEKTEEVISKEKEVFALLKSAGELPKLLIVEDNPAVRDYIEECFEGMFSIKTAENGVLGLKSATVNNPDLIISDVMMPEMDGISMCRALKEDERTNHIPIILLTARTAATFKLEGLEMGADDYVTKPFSPKELRLRARNLLSSRLKIRNKLVRLGILEPKEIELSSTEEIFLEKAMTLVEEHIDQPDFNVEKFAREMAVSRAFLFTKLKEVTNQTPNNFVKVIRLKRAAQLLKEYNLEVSQVAYKVGFRDPRYFSKCFKKMYAVSPSEYHNKQDERMLS